MPSWSVTLPRTAAERATAKFIRDASPTKSGIVTSATIDPSTHTSRQNNSSHTSTTTAGASTPAKLRTSQPICWDSMQPRTASLSTSTCSKRHKAN
eukprot:CCRYP_021181-RA/>CCRYP_021181-RA protein AED:0.38 eAED:0.38 QI:0/-1/0/1/-1/1/1/0/95